MVDHTQEVHMGKASDHQMGMEEAQGWLAAIINSAEDAIISKDLNGVITSWNPAAERFFGYTAPEAIGRPITMIIPPDRLDEEAEILARIRRGESIDHFETVRRRKDGTLLDISLTVSPILDSQGQITGASKIARDITERRHVDALRKSQEELIDFIEAATLGVHRVGPDGIILWANRAELQMLGYEPDEYFGRHISDFHADQTVIQDIMQRLAHGATIHDYEATLRAKDGSLRYVRIDSTGFWENGQFKYTRCFTRDETERKRAEEDIRRLNQDLQKLVNELQTVFDVSPMGIGVAEDHECRVIRVNPAFAEMVGISPEVNASKTAEPEQLLPFKVFKNGRELRGEELPMQVAAARGIFVTGEEMELQREDGRVVNVLMHAAPLLDEEGRPRGCVGTMVDISELKGVEEALRENRAELEWQMRLFEATHSFVADHVYIFDKDKRFIYANRALQKLWGLTEVEYRGKNMVDLMYPAKLAEHLNQHVQKVFETGETVTDEVAYASPTDVSGSFEYTFSPVTASDGSVGLVVGTSRNITERKRAEEERERLLREVETQQERLSDIFQQAPSFMCVVRGPDHVFERANDLYYQLVGHREILGKSVRQLFPEVEGQGYFELLNRVYQTGEPFVGSGVPIKLQRQPDGPLEIRYVDLVYQPLRDPDGSISGVFAQGVDLTERKQAEEALLEAARRKDQFLAMLSHELRNPMAPITNALHLLRMDQGDSSLRQEAIDVLERQVGTLNRLVEDLLDVSRVTTGRVHLQKTDIELNALVQSTADSFRPQMEARQHQFLTALSEHPVWVKGDPTRLEQVVVNLLSNAAKFSPNGSQIWLSTEEVRGEAVIRVRDSGMGIEADMLSHIFGLFSQGEAGLDRSQGGLGIGLSLVKSLVEMHRGTVTAASEGLDRGSEFVVRLPVVSPPLPEQPQPGEDQNSSVVRLRVLLVEDLEDARRILGRVLSRLGHQVRTAHDGPSALAAALEFRPSVVLLDIGLPGMDGYEVARQMRREPALQGTVLVAVTGYGQESDRQRAHEAGFDHHLVKPLDIGKLEQLLAAIGSRPA